MSAQAYLGRKAASTSHRLLSSLRQPKTISAFRLPNSTTTPQPFDYHFDYNIAQHCLSYDSSLQVYCSRYAI
jgi:hypothetical protein